MRLREGLQSDRLEPCGGSDARRRHLARLEHCDRCGTEGPKPTVYCDGCRVSVPAGAACNCVEVAA